MCRCGMEGADVMITWKDRTILILDTETTGLDPETSRVWEVGLLMVNGTRELAAESIIVNPGEPIPAEIVELCKLTARDVAVIGAARTFDDSAWEPLHRAMLTTGIVAGYNLLEYDWPLLFAEFRRCFGKMPGVDRLDPLVWVRELCNLRHRGLAEACAAIAGADPLWAGNQGDAHRALGDCRMTWAILRALAPKMPEDLVDCIELQHRWKVRQDYDFQRYGYWLSTAKDGSLVMACGKHFGVRLEDVDRGYLSWALRKSPEWDEPLPGAVQTVFRAMVRRAS